jgi:hypothetical protein
MCHPPWSYILVAFCEPYFSCAHPPFV